MTTTVSVKGGPAMPVRSTGDPAIGLTALRAYGFATPAAAQAAGYTCEGGGATSIYIVSAAEIASGKFLLEGDPAATPIYTAPTGTPVEGGYSTPIYLVGGSL